MTATLKSFFDTNPTLHFTDGLYVQNLDSHFEQLYTELRNREGRLYEDAVVAKLPNLFPAGQEKEWKVRKHSSDKLITYLSKKRIQSVLELGCGNGWLTAYINRSLNIECAGIDINMLELKQAVNVFGKMNKLHFACIDIFSAGFIRTPCTDVVVVASASQYFPSLSKLIEQLTPLLHQHGEIHLIDSPMYSQQKVAEARARSVQYFDKMRQPGMQNHYHHHTWEELAGFNREIIYNPGLLSKFLPGYSPFPWIVIRP